jgi:hypothetical protein
MAKPPSPKTAIVERYLMAVHDQISAWTSPDLGKPDLARTADLMIVR